MAEPLLAGSPDHVEALATLGLRLEYFQDAVRAGEQARRLVTENDPSLRPERTTTSAGCACFGSA